MPDQATPNLSAPHATRSSAPKRRRKKRKPLQPTPIDQADTAVATYHGEVKRDFKGMRKIIVQILMGRSMTAAEIRADIRVATGLDVPESTIFGQLHSLFHAGAVTDRDTQDRPCRITGRQKKT